MKGGDRVGKLKIGDREELCGQVREKEEKVEMIIKVRWGEQDGGWRHGMRKGGYTYRLILICRSWSRQKSWW